MLLEGTAPVIEQDAAPPWLVISSGFVPEALAFVVPEMQDEPSVEDLDEVLELRCASL